ncbi:MAG: hypothetical protein V2A56_09540 [bacterium]
MQSLIDIMGAMFIGGILILVAMTALDSGLQAFVNNNADAIVQNELADLSRTMQFDLRKMGYSIPEAQSTSILQIALTNRLKFLTNLNLSEPYNGTGGIDSTPDTIEYRVTPFQTYNFIDTSIVLYGLYRTVKVVGHATETLQVGTITNTDVFRYLDQAGNPVVYIPATKMVEVTFVSLNPEIYLNREVLLASSPQERMTELRKLVRESFWRQTRVVSKNLRR